MTCVIVGAGDFRGLHEGYKADYIIAADGGYDRLREYGLTPNLIIGDMDSIREVPDVIAENIEVITYPRDKDKTDMELALDEAAKRGFDRFYIYGGLGDRPDQTIANIFLAARFSRKYTLYLIGKNMIISAVTDGGVKFGAGYNGLVSVFAFGGDAHGVNVKGLKYTMNNGLLRWGSSLGVSNEFTGEEGVISVKKGCLIIIVLTAE